MCRCRPEVKTPCCGSEECHKGIECCEFCFMLSKDHKPKSAAIVNITFNLVSSKGWIHITQSKSNNMKVWIDRGDGEGGEFDAGALYDVIDKFYKENF